MLTAEGGDGGGLLTTTLLLLLLFELEEAPAEFVSLGQPVIPAKHECVGSEHSRRDPPGHGSHTLLALEADTPHCHYIIVFCFVTYVRLFVCKFVC